MNLTKVAALSFILITLLFSIFTVSYVYGKFFTWLDKPPAQPIIKILDSES